MTSKWHPIFHQYERAMRCFLVMTSRIMMSARYREYSVLLHARYREYSVLLQRVMATPGNPSYNRTAALVLGILQVVIGVVNIIVQIVMYSENLYLIGPASVGVWTGIFVSSLRDNCLKPYGRIPWNSCYASIKFMLWSAVLAAKESMNQQLDQTVLNCYDSGTLYYVTPGPLLLIWFNFDMI